MKKLPRFRIATLFWTVLLVATFLAARNPILDPIFDSFNRRSIIELDGKSQLFSRSEPDVLDVVAMDSTTCALIPKKKGMCLVEFKTTNGLEAFLVHVTATKNIHIQSTNTENRVSSLFDVASSNSNVIDEAFGAFQHIEFDKAD